MNEKSGKNGNYFIIYIGCKFIIIKVFIKFIELLKILILRFEYF